MADLGVYNFVRTSLESGKSEEWIAAALAKSGLSEGAIAEAFEAVKSERKPVVSSDAAPLLAHAARARERVMLGVMAAVAACIIGYALYAYAEPGLQDGGSSCAQPDDCVKSDIKQINEEAAALNAYAGSYASLCANGVVNTSAATGTSLKAADLNAALRNAVNQILLARNAPSQEGAGIRCGSTDTRYYVSAMMTVDPSAPDYCVDSRGVATTSTPNLSTTFCGSELSSF